MSIIHPNCVYSRISSLRNHWIHVFSGRISLNTNNKIKWKNALYVKHPTEDSITHLLLANKIFPAFVDPDGNFTVIIRGF